MKRLTQGRLKEVLHYDPVSGVWTWLETRGRISAGSIAGCIHPNGYRHIKIDYRLYSSSRLAFLYMIGRWPADEVDHKDINPGNDRWENLREATRAQNLANTRGRLGRSLPKGVRQIRGKFRAKITPHGKQFYLGTYTTPEDAHTAYAKAANQLFGPFARAK